MFEIWMLRVGQRRYLPSCWFFEREDAGFFAGSLRKRGLRAKVLYNVSCSMPDWKPSNKDIIKERKTRFC